MFQDLNEPLNYQSNPDILQQTYQSEYWWYKWYHKYLIKYLNIN